MIAHPAERFEAIRDVIPGVAFKVYRAKDGAWHGHVTGLRRDDLDDLKMRPTSISAEGIAYAALRDAASHGIDLEDVLDARPSRYSARLIVGGSGPWTDVGHCSTEAEARDRCAAVVGHVFGRRLAKLLGPHTPPQPSTLSGRKDWTA